jgi:hypothetical protein
MTLDEMLARDAEIMPYRASPNEITAVRLIRSIVEDIIERDGGSMDAKNSALKSTNKHQA